MIANGNRVHSVLILIATIGVTTAASIWAQERQEYRTTAKQDEVLKSDLVSGDERTAMNPCNAG